MEKISPEKYRKILSGIDLKDILLSDIKASIKHEWLSEGMRISIKKNANYAYKDDELIVTNKYVLTAKNNDKKIVLKIEGTFIVVFESEHEINDDFFEKFAIKCMAFFQRIGKLYNFSHEYSTSYITVIKTLIK